VVIYAKQKEEKILINASNEGEFIPRSIINKNIGEYIEKFPQYNGGFYALCQGEEFRLTTELSDYIPRNLGDDRKGYFTQF